MQDIYFDNSATTKILEQSLNIYTEASENLYANPSSLHSAGLKAERRVEEARKIISGTFDAGNDEIYFTSGGTEGDNIAILGSALARRKDGNHIITSRIEHHAVLDCFKFLEEMGFSVTYIDVDKKGVIDIDQLENSVTDKTILISVMTVNNETGVLQPINAIRKIAKNATIHTDAIQAYGKVDLRQIDADLISVSSHKVYGPKGIGALYVKKGTKIKNTVFGGGQEKNLRSGTLNTPAILAFANSVEYMSDNFNLFVNHNKKMSDYMKSELIKKVNDISFNGDSDLGILNVSFKGIRGEVLLHYLESKGIYISTGSACNSKSTRTSYVIDAMGVSREYAEGAVRFSFGMYNTEDEIDIAVKEIANGVEFLRKYKRR